MRRPRAGRPAIPAKAILRGRPVCEVGIQTLERRTIHAPASVGTLAALKLANRRFGLRAEQAVLLERRLSASGVERALNRAHVFSTVAAVDGFGALPRFGQARALRIGTAGLAAEGGRSTGLCGNWCDGHQVSLSNPDWRSFALFSITYGYSRRTSAVLCTRDTAATVGRCKSTCGTRTARSPVFTGRSGSHVAPEVAPQPRLRRLMSVSCTRDRREPQRRAVASSRSVRGEPKVGDSLYRTASCRRSGRRPAPRRWPRPPGSGRGARPLRQRPHRRWSSGS